MKLYKGEYSVSKSGRAMTLTIPSDIVKTWGIGPRDKVHVYFDDGKMVVSPEKLKE